ncbi:MAG: AMP-binding protein [Acidimicrobiales bacterium]
MATGYVAGRSPESFTPDGWLRTGDVATVDPSRSIRIVDRIKDVIKSGGEWISSIELELHLMAHPSVAEAAVVGVDDERWGERPVAFLVASDPTSPPNPEELRSHLAELVPSWWVPDRYEVIDEVPKTSVGKFAKAELRERLGT